MKLRPRFSVRTLTIFLTLVCVSVAGWKGASDASNASADKMWRIDDNRIAWIEKTSAPLPFIIGRHECECGGRPTFAGDGDQSTETRRLYRRYYLWLFGPMIKLPLEFDVTK
jgi:hypothetical protein